MYTVHRVPATRIIHDGVRVFDSVIFNAGWRHFIVCIVRGAARYGRSPRQYIYIHDSMRESEMRKEEKRSLGISKLDAAFLSRSPFAEIFVVIKTVLH